MSKLDLETGRTKQKAQTRTRILEAASELTSLKNTISLDDVAKHANISRATIYRYYSDVDTLLIEASLNSKYAAPEEIFEKVKGLSLYDRVIYIQKYYNNLAQSNEAVFRRYLSAVLSKSMSDKKHLRGARRVKALKLALATYKKELGEDTYKKLINAASVLMGIESVIVSKDVCQLTKQETEESLTWAMEMMLKGISASS